MRSFPSLSLTTAISVMVPIAALCVDSAFARQVAPVDVPKPVAPGEPGPKPGPTPGPKPAAEGLLPAAVVAPFQRAANGSRTLRTQDPVQALPADEALRTKAIAPLTSELVADLDAKEYAKRRAASERLQGSEVPLEEILAVLAQQGSEGRPSLSAEQHHRLLSIAFDRVVNAPRGALGIQFMKGGGGVRVTDVIPGFPAEKHLIVDDIIVAIDGLAVRETEDLLALVQGHPPGTEVRVEAIRSERDARGKPRLDAAGQPVTRRIDVRVAFGSKRELDNTGAGRMRSPMDPFDMGRQELGLQLLRRFPPLVSQVRLPDDAKVEADFAARDVDRHEMVEDLTREVDDARNQQRALAPDVVLRYQGKLRLIKDLVNEPSCSEAERGWYRRVIARMEELLRMGSDTKPGASGADQP